MPKTEAFTISRTLKAPRKLVFACFTTADQMAKWFGPTASAIVHSEMDFREGGLYHYAMAYGDAPPMWGRFFYRRIVAPSSIQLISCFSNPEGGITRAPFFDGKWPLEMESEYAFEEAGKGSTTLSITWRPLGAAAEEIATFDANRESMTDGWSGTLDRIESHLATIKQL